MDGAMKFARSQSLLTLTPCVLSLLLTYLEGTEKKVSSPRLGPGERGGLQGVVQDRRTASDSFDATLKTPLHCLFHNQLLWGWIPKAYRLKAKNNHNL